MRGLRFPSAVALFVYACFPGAGRGEVFLVTQTGDVGAGSLRQAIIDANGTPGEHRIEFQILSGGFYHIQPLSALPEVTGPIVIDGWSQPGFDGLPLIELSGDQAGSADGLRLGGGFCTVRGLIVNRFQRAGLRLMGGTNVIQGNFIGTDASGRFSLGNGEAGVDMFLGSGHNLIGGPTASERNIISGNRWGLYVLAGENRIQGNYIGTDVDGVFALGNGTGIALVRSSRNEIGGAQPGEGNLISGNLGHGLQLVGGFNDGPSFNAVAGNIIGLDVSGARVVANGAHGIEVGANAATNTFGGLEPAAGNILSGNLGSGLVLLNSQPGNRVLGSFIGTDRTGTNGLANHEHGVRIVAHGQLVGGSEAGAGNWIAFNGQAGIAVESGTNNLIQGNRLFGNSGLAVALGTAGSGRTINDDADADEGANHLQNFPELGTARRLSGQVTVGGTLRSQPNRPYHLEFFASPSCGSTGGGEGFVVLGRTNVSTGPSGLASFSIDFFQPLPEEWFLSATATDADGNTSEVSTCFPLADDPSLALQLSATLEPGGVRVSFTARANKSYTVQSRTELGAGGWANLLQWLARPTDSLVTLTNPVSAEVPLRFYRVVSPAQPE